MQFLFNLKLILKFLLNPLRHVAESHLPLPQFGTNVQLKLGWRTEAVPVGKIATLLQSCSSNM